MLWSDVDDRKAVIWCEDQGDLAYMNSPDTVLDAEDFFDAGDLVQFDMDTSQRTRYAYNARLVFEKARPTLAEVLVDSSAQVAAPLISNNVIPLHRHRVDPVPTDH